MRIKKSKYLSSAWGSVPTFLSEQRGLLLFSIILFLVITPAEAQCSMCRAVLESEEGGKTAEGINNGILYLMAIPYLIVGTIFFFVYKKLRKSN